MPRMKQEVFEKTTAGVPVYIARPALVELMEECRRARAAEKVAYRIMTAGCAPSAVLKFLKTYAETELAQPYDGPIAQR